MNKLKALTSCQSCFQTYAFAASTSARNMLAYSCVKDLSNTKITTLTRSLSFSQVEFSTMMNNYLKKKSEN